MNTPYFKMRFASSGDRDLAMLMNWAASLSGKSAAYARQLTEYGSLPMRLAMPWRCFPEAGQSTNIITII